MLEITEETENTYVPAELEKTEKITKFIKERVNEFRCEIQEKLENINNLIAEIEYEKNQIIVEINVLRTKVEEAENNQKQNSIIKRENKLIRALRILRENAYLWQEIEKEDVIELRNEFGELRGIIAKSNIVKAEQEIFKTKKKYNFFKKLRDITNIKYEKIEANIKASNEEIEKINQDILKFENKIKEKIYEIDGMNEIKFAIEELLENYKDNVMESLEKNSADKVLELIDILNETKQKLKVICGDVELLN